LVVYFLREATVLFVVHRLWIDYMSTVLLVVL
jgi:hypothetical protein